MEEDDSSPRTSHIDVYILIFYYNFVQLHTYKINSMGGGILGKFYGWLVYINFYLILWVIEFYLNLILLVMHKKSNLFLWVVEVKKKSRTFFWNSPKHIYNKIHTKTLKKIIRLILLLSSFELNKPEFQILSRPKLKFISHMLGLYSFIVSINNFN